MLYTWRRQALAGDLTGAKRTSVPSFAEVEVTVPTAATAGSGQIGIELPSGVRLTVDAAVDASALARVMSVLARCSRYHRRHASTSPAAPPTRARGSMASRCWRRDERGDGSDVGSPGRTWWESAAF